MVTKYFLLLLVIFLEVGMFQYQSDEIFSVLIHIIGNRSLTLQMDSKCVLNCYYGPNYILMILVGFCWCWLIVVVGGHYLVLTIIWCLTTTWGIPIKLSFMTFHKGPKVVLWSSIIFCWLWFFFGVGMFQYKICELFSVLIHITDNNS